MAEFVEKRKIGELIRIYKLHPEVKDLFVEGVSDRLFYEKLFNEIEDLKIIEIDFIDFEEFEDEECDFKSNNKRKIIRLTEILFESFDIELKYIAGIVDSDYEHKCNAMKWNIYLYYTDFTSLEMYCFNKESLEIFFEEVLHGFPIPSDTVLKTFTPILRYLFFISFIIKREFSDNFNSLNEFIFIEYDKKNLFEINKTTGLITFNEKEYLYRMLNTNKLLAHLQSFKAKITYLLESSIDDPRKEINGKDFVQLLYVYIKKIKNSLELKVEIIKRILPHYCKIDIVKNEYIINQLYNRFLT